MVSLPYSKKKRYLTGIDWVIGALDRLTRNATGTGISSQIVLELDRPISKEDLRDRLRLTARAMPVLSGAPARDINLAPYWKAPIVSSAGALDPTVHFPKSDSPEHVLPCLVGTVNEPFASDSEHLKFHIVYPKLSNRCLLAMVFDHRLFDARGAEMFLDAVHKNEPPPLEPEPAHLDRWARRFRAGRHVNRTLAAMSGSPIDTIPLPDKLKGRPAKFVLCCLEESETRPITERAENEAGYLMLMPYVLAATLQQLDAFLQDKGHPRGNYAVPVSTDIRSQKDARQILFNHLSFLLLHMTGDRLTDKAAVIQSIKAQMYDQSKHGLPRDLWDVTMLMRIVPAWLLARIMPKIPLMLGSLSFSCVGRTEYESDMFMGAKVLNLFHMPRVPTPPGYGFFFNEFGSGLNVVFSYVDGMLTEDEANGLVGRVVTAL